MSLLAVGVSHRTAPVALLEQFAMAAEDRVKALHELVDSDHVSEALVLATCNRIEVFAEVERFHGGVTDVSRVLARQAGATVEELSPYVTVHYEDQAVAHLFTVAAGLDSMVVGETQVLGQLRAAYALARDQGTVGRALHPVAQRALRVGKRVHTETGIDRAGASLVSVALDRAEDRIGSLQGRRVLVVGAGSMGALSATTLARRGAEVVVSSRTQAHAARLATTVGGRAADLATLPEELAVADVLVTCTGATGLVVHTDVVRAAMAGRSGRPLVVVDLALPRDVDPGVAGLPGVHVVDLALLRVSAPRRPAARPPGPSPPTTSPPRTRSSRRRPRCSAPSARRPRWRRRSRRCAARPPTWSTPSSCGWPAGCPTWTPGRAPRSPGRSAASSTSCCTSRPSA